MSTIYLSESERLLIQCGVICYADDWDYISTRMASSRELSRRLWDQRRMNQVRLNAERLREWRAKYHRLLVRDYAPREPQPPDDFLDRASTKLTFIVVAFAAMYVGAHLFVAAYEAWLRPALAVLLE